jgi:hypothetical protein
MVFTRKQRQESESETDEGQIVSKTKTKYSSTVTQNKAKPFFESKNESESDQSDQEIDDDETGNIVALTKELKKDSDNELENEGEFLRKENVKKILLDLRQENIHKGHSQQVGNSLTLLIPGYTAPMKLDSKTSDEL